MPPKIKRARPKAAIARQFIGIFVVAGLLITLYASSTALSEWLFSYGQYKATVAEQGSPLDPEIVPEVPMVIDLTRYAQALLDSGLLEDPALQDFLTDPANLADFMSLLGNQLGDLSDPGMWDNIDPALLALAMGQNIFYVSANPILWSTPSETRFLSTTFDQYDLSDFTWKASAGLDQEIGLAYDSDESGLNLWNIIYPFSSAADVKSAIPSVFPSPRIVDMSLDMSPTIPTTIGPNLKQQDFLGGAFYEASFAAENQDQEFNVSYQLRYDASDYPTAAYYRTNAAAMSSYFGTDTLVLECLTGPNGESGVIDWAEYRSTNPDFDAFITELESNSTFSSAANAFLKTEALLNFIRDNIAFNLLYGNSPGDAVDPIEWLAGTRQTKNPLYFSSFIVAAAKAAGLSARMGSGYRYDQDIADFYNSTPYTDPNDPSRMIYPFIRANTYMWPIVFIPMSGSTGDWVEFNPRLKYGTELTPQQLAETYLLLKYDGQPIPDVNGYSKADTIQIEFNLTIGGESMNGQTITIRDRTYNRLIGQTNLTGSGSNPQGVVTYGLSLTNFEAGPHLLNMSSIYLGQTIYNLTFPLINIISPVSIIQKPIVPNPLNVTNPINKVIQISGYALDTTLNKPVQNARIDYTLYERDNLLNDWTANLTIKSGTTNSSGNYTTSTRSDVVQNNYTLYTTFAGVFDVSGTFYYLPDPLKALFESVPYYSISPNTDVKSRNYEVIDWYAATLVFAINGTLPNPGSPSPPLNGTRNAMWLRLSVSIKQAGSPRSGTVEIRDRLEGNNLVTTLHPGSSGNTTLILPIPNSIYWTVGPHLLYAQWIDAPQTQTSNGIWIMVHAPLRLRMSPYSAYVNPNYGTNTYQKGNPADIFSISGNITDIATGERITNYRINYRVRDTLGNYYTNILSPANYQQDVTGLTFSQSYSYTSMTDASLDYRGAPYFSGYYTDPGEAEIWDPSWNSLWSAHYALNPVSNQSTGLMNIQDPTNVIFTCALDGNATVNEFSSSDTFNGGNPPPIKNTGQNAVFHVRFVYDGNQNTGATVTVTDLTTGVIVNTNNTWATTGGWCRITKSYTTGDNPGPHRYEIKVTYTSLPTPGYLTTETYIFVNATLKLAFWSPTSNKDLTRGDTTDYVELRGSLRNAATNLRGLFYGKLSLVIIDKNGKTHPYGDWAQIVYSAPSYTDGVTLPPNFVPDQEGNFTIRVSAKLASNLGIYSFKMVYIGEFNPGGSNPTFAWSYPLLSINSSMIQVTAYDKPKVATGTATFTPYLFTGGGEWVIGITRLNFTGQVVYSNNTALKNENVYIEILAADQTTVLHTTSIDATDLSGYYNINGIVWYDTYKYYRVVYAGKPAIYTIGFQSSLMPI